jgi:hypothetical protein
MFNAIASCHCALIVRGRSIFSKKEKYHPFVRTIWGDESIESDAQYKPISDTQSDAGPWKANVSVRKMLPWISQGLDTPILRRAQFLQLEHWQSQRTHRRVLLRGAAF